MLRRFSVSVPTCIIGQALVHLNYPVLCYASNEDVLLVRFSPGEGKLVASWLGPLAKYVEERLARVARSLKLNLEVKEKKPLPPLDALIAVLQVVVREVGAKKTTADYVARTLGIQQSRVEVVLKAMSTKGLLAYRRGEGLINLQGEFPWSIAICLKRPFKFRLLKNEELEEHLEAVIHALGRLVVTVAHSVMDYNFKQFRNALIRYTKLCYALSKTSFSTLRLYERLSKMDKVACKLDEDFKGFMLFSEDEDQLVKCIELARKMGYEATILKRV